MAAPEVRLNLKPREIFAAMKLHEKNAYLQEIADTFCDNTDRPRTVLDKTALSRLRRYYSRRVWADLQIPDEPIDSLHKILKRYGEAIRMSAVEEDVKGALVAGLPGRTLRSPPADDAQLSFFVPAVYDAPIKDDVNLMDVAPFVLSTKTRAGVIEYELKDCIITVEGGAQSGIATIFDYDIS